MTDLEFFDYRRDLRNLFNMRRNKNSSYSLRAFARDLSVSPTALHGVLSGTRHFSKKNLERLAIKLGWTQIKIDAALNNLNILDDPTEVILEEDRFSMIADWIHLAILNLINIPSTKREAIPERLGLSRKICEEAIERLLRLEYLEINDGKLIRRLPSFGTKQDIPSLAVRAFHHKNLEKTQMVLESVPLEKREFLTVAVATNSNKIQKLKKRIQEFRKEVMEILETPDPEEVYFLNIQLFPVSISNGEKIK